MRRRWDLAEERWTLRGWRPNDWRWETSFVRVDSRNPDVGALAAPVPGSVRGALVAAGRVANPYSGFDSRASEWIEHRHWTYSVQIPEDVVEAAAGAGRIVLQAQSLDGPGVVLVDTTEVARFANALVPQRFDLTDAIRSGGTVLTIAFTTPPADIGQIGWTSRIRDWKARYNYGWDWTPRIVQLGIVGGIALEYVQGNRIERLLVDPRFDPETGQGSVRVRARTTVGEDVEVAFAADGEEPEIRRVAADDAWHTIDVGDVRPWTVHTLGEQPMYSVTVRAFDRDVVADETVRRVGFRHIDWRNTEDAPSGAEPWLLTINGAPVFMAGVNWVPIRPDYADVTVADYEVRMRAYRDIGIVMLRVWGGAARESDDFYRLADELGFVVWQELPLSSSGFDNFPPVDPEFADGYEQIATEYAVALMHHACIAIWGGGNELASTAEGVDPLPAVVTQQPFARAATVFAEIDPGRRFVASSPSGPTVWAFAENYGKGIHHDVHGPWEFDGSFEEWQSYWDGDDSLLRSEVGIGGASSYDLLERYDLVGPTGTAEERELLVQRWAHSASWWLKPARNWDGEGPLREWVDQNQTRQAEWLAYAAGTARSRFPRCGGFIVWLGHDTYPCPVSLSLLDFEGRPKPVAAALGRVFSGEPSGDS